jgi:hypothetical protein
MAQKLLDQVTQVARLKHLSMAAATACRSCIFSLNSFSSCAPALKVIVIYFE